MSKKVPTINGYAYDYSAISISVAGISFSGINSISYSDGVERTKIYGTGPKPMGVTRGQYSAEGSMEFYKHEWDRFASSIKNIYDVIFDVTVTYKTPGQQINFDKLVQCRIDKVENSGSAGSDGLMVPVTLNVMDIIRNGKSGMAESDVLDQALAIASSASSIATSLGL
jgi:hypothetical protein